MAKRTTTPATRRVYHLDTKRIGTLFTKSPRVKGNVPVLFDGHDVITLVFPSRLRNLNA